MRIYLVLIFLFLATCHVRADEPATMLPRFAGVWRTRGESKPSKWSPERTTFSVQETTQPVLKGKFLLGREHSQPDGEKSLWLMTFDPQRNVYPFWMFDSHGLLGGEWELSWDAATSAARGHATDTPRGWTSHGTNRFPDADTNIVDYWMKDETGTLLIDSHSEKKRQPAADGPAILEAWSKSEPAVDRPQELTILDPFLGVWDAVTIARPAEWTPAETRSTSVVTRQWVLNERFLLDSSQHADGQESLSLFGYDPQAREYRTWWFHSEGHRNKSRGAWDASARTFNFQAKLEDGKVSHSTVRLVSADEHEWRIKVTDTAGKIYYDATISTKRRSPTAGAAP